LSIASGISALVTTAINAAGLSLGKWRLIKFTMNAPAASIAVIESVAEIPLATASFQMKIKSHLKIQNRTVNVVGDTVSDEIDTVPLEGRLYRARGNNLLHVNSKTTLQAVGDNAVIRFTAARDGALSELLPASQFRNCKSYAKFKIPAGGIKTSSLYENKVISLTSFFNTLYGYALDSYHPMFGNCQVFALDKIIGSYTTPILIAYENQYSIQACVLYKSSFQTDVYLDQN
jgi:hypothetical protein